MMRFRLVAVMAFVFSTVSCSDRYEPDFMDDGCVYVNIDRCSESSLGRIIRNASRQDLHAYKLSGKFKPFIRTCFQTSDVVCLDMRDVTGWPTVDIEPGRENLPAIEKFFFSMREGAFSKLQTVYLPFSVEYLGDGAFIRNKTLREVYADGLNVCGMSTFEGCENLETVYLPKVERMGIQSFKDCRSLKDIELPCLSILECSVFQGCEELEKLSLPSVRRLDSQCIFICRSLSLIELPSAVEFCYHSITDSCADNAEMVISSPESIYAENAFNLDTGKINLVLNDDKRNGKSESYPEVEPDGKTWNGSTWSSVEYVL